MNIKIDSYPSIKAYLTQFGIPRLEQSGEKGARKKTPHKWFETQDTIGYWEDFSKPKIIYPNMTKFTPFYLDTCSFLTNDKAFIITGDNLEFLTAFLNSIIFRYCYLDMFPNLGGGTVELRKIFFEKIKVPLPSAAQNDYCRERLKDYTNAVSVEAKKNIDAMLLHFFYDLFALSPKEQQVIERESQ